MANVWDIEVTYAHGRKKIFRGEFGGSSNITEEMVKAHYDALQSRSNPGVHPFDKAGFGPALSWRVIPETATEVPGRVLVGEEGQKPDALPPDIDRAPGTPATPATV